MTSRYLRILHKAEPTWRLFVLIEPHDNSLDFTTHGKQFVHLVLGCIEGEIANVKGGRQKELLVIFLGTAL